MACINNYTEWSPHSQEEAEEMVRGMDDGNITKVLSAHRDKSWQEKLREENGGAIHPSVRRFMRLVEQEAHRRGLGS